MQKFLIAALLCFFSVTLFAQKKDRLKIVSRNDKWFIEHHVSQGETVFQLARRYHVPPAMLADENGVGYQSTLQDGSIMYVPVGAYNFVTTQPANASDSRVAYYTVSNGESLSRISKKAGVSQYVIQEMNGMPDNTVEDGQQLKVGWILFDATNSSPSTKNEGAIHGMPQSKPVEVPAKPVITKKTVDSNSKYTVRLITKSIKLPDGTMATELARDTVWADTLGPGGRVYMAQTKNEQNVTEEKGTVAFFDNAGKPTSSKTFFAFHRTLPKGTAVKVYNPGTNKYIFVKVIGPIPDTKQYFNCILGLSTAAKEALGVLEEKAWCELKYAEHW
ncbi:MAG: LysM peptidoglycan-binding domain-containing protein [Bacteroidetes bacterium]|nr:LysM peptidoglycan-binding domain-containing protein [Bacteroidota bacterium]